MSKRGRPKKDDGRNIQCKVLLTKEEYDDLTNISEITKTSKSEIIRKGLQINLEFMKNGVNY